MRVQTFVRSWYVKNDKGQYVPGPGRKSNIEYCNSVEEAREKCKRYNDNNKPGPSSRKMEFTTNF